MSSTRLSRICSLLCAVFLLLDLAACSSSSARHLPARTYTPASGGRLPAFSHIFVIVMENHDYGAIIGNPDAPYVNALARRYALATQYYAVSHPSLPNYLALVGGSDFGVQSDCETCFISAPNLVDALEQGNKTWRAYMEAMPKPCDLRDTTLYRVKHNPFVYFDDIRTNARRCRQVVPYTQLSDDLAHSTVPDFVWISPDMCSDTHDCSTRTGDNWLAREVPRILASSAWRENGVLFLTWDEGTSNDGCCQYASGGHIATLVISPLVTPGYRSATPYDHYSLLRTIADAWHLAEPGNAAARATFPMTDFFASHT